MGRRLFFFEAFDVMRVLLMAPQPFFAERGTPIAVRLLAQTLQEQGHEVDLLTYPMGVDAHLAGVTHYRCRRFPGVGDVPIGFSFAKLLTDIMLIASFARHAARGRYDVIHAVEEAVYPALLLRWRHRAAVVYDMDSSMAQQLADLGRLPRLLLPLFERLERSAIARADAVAAVCEDLVNRVLEDRAADTVYLLNDVPVAQQGAAATDRLRDHAAPGRAVALYVGNLSRYQGIDLLVDAVAALGDADPVDIVVVGGPADAVAHYRDMADASGIAGRLTFIGPRPLAQLGALLEQADILLSPRTKGDNTPLKIYSYMAAERAILATDLRTHTQVLDERSAFLVPSEAAAFAEGLAVLAKDPTLRQRLAHAAAEQVRTRYSIDAFRATVAALYGCLAVEKPRVASGVDRSAADPATDPVVDPPQRFEREPATAGGTASRRTGGTASPRP